MNQQNKVAKLLGIIFLSVGILFLIPGLIFYGVLGRWAWEDTDLMILGLVFSIVGIFFTTAGTVSLCIARNRNKKAERLLREGECFDAQIVRVYENPYSAINYRHPLVVECWYPDRMGRKCLVKSGNIWPDHRMVSQCDIKAKVYVNPSNPKDYFVEVAFAKEDQNTPEKFDYDFR